MLSISSRGWRSLEPDAVLDYHWITSGKRRAEPSAGIFASISPHPQRGAVSRAVREAKALRERGVPAEPVRTVAVGESVMLSH